MRVRARSVFHEGAAALKLLRDSDPRLAVPQHLPRHSFLQVLRRSAVSIDDRLPRARSARRADVFPAGVALVTPYPTGEAVPVHGVANYAQALARALEVSGASVEVWANRPGGLVPAEAVDAGVRVFRVWRRGLWVGLDLWRILQERRPAILHVQIEHFVYGGMPGFLSLLAFLLASRFTGQKVILTLHHVIGMKDLSGELLRESGLPRSVRLAGMLVRVSTVLLHRLANEIIVHENVFRHRLVEEGGLGPARIHIVSHGVPRAEPLAAANGAAKRVLCFGYLKWYKGIDIALRAFREVARDFPQWRLVVAGGLPPGLEESHPHRRFLAHLRELAAPLGDQVEFTGYVANAELPLLFQQTDVVLFPYRVLFAFSGPLALAIGARRPFIVSEALKSLLPTWPYWSRNTPEDWARSMRILMRSDELRARAERQADVLASTREWSEIAVQTLTVYRQAESLEAALNSSR